MAGGLPAHRGRRLPARHPVRGRQLGWQPGRRTRSLQPHRGLRRTPHPGRRLHQRRQRPGPGQDRQLHLRRVRAGGQHHHHDQRRRRHRQPDHHRQQTRLHLERLGHRHLDLGHRDLPDRFPGLHRPRGSQRQPLRLHLHQLRRPAQHSGPDRRPHPGRGDPGRPVHRLRQRGQRLRPQRPDQREQGLRRLGQRRGRRRRRRPGREHRPCGLHGGRHPVQRLHRLRPHLPGLAHLHRERAQPITEHRLLDLHHTPAERADRGRGGGQVRRRLE